MSRWVIMGGPLFREGWAGVQSFSNRDVLRERQRLNHVRCFMTHMRLERAPSPCMVVGSPLTVPHHEVDGAS